MTPPKPLPATLEPGLSEKTFGTWVEHAATVNGWLWMHVRPLKVPGRGGKFITPTASGFPDYIMCHERSGRLFVLEIKTADGKLTPKQKTWLNMLERIPSVDAFFARPADWPNIVAYLERPNRQPS